MEGLEPDGYFPKAPLARQLVWNVVWCALLCTWCGISCLLFSPSFTQGFLSGQHHNERET